MGIDKLATLPIYFQVMLACGYLGYVIARQGFRRNEQMADQLFGAIIFGLPALPAWFLTLDITQNIPLAASVSFIFCVIFAIWWRVALAELWVSFAHKRRISNEDGQGYVLDYLTQNTSLCPTQITVYLKSGEKLFCENMQAFQHSAIDAPMRYDTAGNIALFVTHEWKNDVWTPIENISMEQWGDLLVYIPVSEIIRIETRYINLDKP
ncbi:MAG: hypothetical protein QJT80_06810 [Candidatus Thiocaldithrix dubininis]|jgi:hypothetical protein|uniref:Uncharacterized protein n=1 Tax=Candidatus Thiocaldithrix dubininis TaxID=3080823 RepID=A0AA95H7C9_9GAMM|nr:MAG: hypothetical protein QJT80_06810 [Candidatus Thiocaldithrix dubininis]